MVQQDFTMSVYEPATLLYLRNLAGARPYSQPCSRRLLTIIYSQRLGIFPRPFFPYEDFNFPFFSSLIFPLFFVNLGLTSVLFYLLQGGILLEHAPAPRAVLFSSSPFFFVYICKRSRSFPRIPLIERLLSLNAIVCVPPLSLPRSPLQPAHYCDPWLFSYRWRPFVWLIFGLNVAA